MGSFSQESFLQQIKEKEHHYLGYCPEKGWIYSVQTGQNEYTIFAVREGSVEPLITFKIRGQPPVTPTQTSSTPL